MSKLAFGFCVGLAAGLVLATLFGHKPVWDIDLPSDIDPTSIPKPGFPVDKVGK